MKMAVAFGRGPDGHYFVEYSDASALNLLKGGLTAKPERCYQAVESRMKHRLHNYGASLRYSKNSHAIALHKVLHLLSTPEYSGII